MENVNEHAPKCTQSPFIFFLPRAARIGSAFGPVLATDDDFGDTVSYSINRNGKLYYHYMCCNIADTLPTSIGRNKTNLFASPY